MARQRVPFMEIDRGIEERIVTLGGKPLNLYKILTHHPKLLSAWIEFAYSLRRDCSTSRGIRELMILRGAQLCKSEYEWQQHLKMASEAGIKQEQIDHLENWRQSSSYSKQEQVCLELMEAIIKGSVSDDLFQRVSEFFSLPECIELVLTGSFYAMVPRVLNALQVPLEEN